MLDLLLNKREGLSLDSMGVKFADLLKLSRDELDQIGLQTIGVNPQNALLPYILGLFADCMLFGVCMMQTGRWFQHCHKDERWPTRVLVYYSVLVNLGITVYLISWNFNLFVYNYGHYFQFLYIDFGSWFYVIDALVRAPVSAFFIDRAWRLSNKNIFLLAFLSLLAVASVGFGIAAKVLALTVYGEPVFNNIIIAWLITHLVCDGLITISITIALVKSKTGWRHTDQIVKKLMIMTAETLLPPTIMSVAFLITYLATGGSTWGIFYVFTSKVFLVCLLVVLNTKFQLRQEMESSAATRDNEYSYALRSRVRNPAVVHVHTETYREGGTGENEDKIASDKKATDDQDLESQHTNGNEGSASLNELEYDKNPSQVQLRP